MIKELEQSELLSLKEYNLFFDAIIKELGSIAVLQKDLDTRRTYAENALDENRKGQQDLLNSLQTKYGPGQIDLDRGLFIPSNTPEPVQPAEDKKESKPEGKTSTRKKS